MTFCYPSSWWCWFIYSRNVDCRQNSTTTAKARLNQIKLCYRMVPTATGLQLVLIRFCYLCAYLPQESKGAFFCNLFHPKKGVKVFLSCYMKWGLIFWLGCWDYGSYKLQQTKAAACAVGFWGNGVDSDPGSEEKNWFWETENIAREISGGSSSIYSTFGDKSWPREKHSR